MIHAKFDPSSRLLSVEATGQVVHEDYDKVLTPAVEKAVADGEPVNMLYRVGPDFQSFGTHAMWDDARLGISHWRDFRRIAVVTDVGWIAGVVRAFGALMPAEVRIFGLSEEKDARAWATG